MSVASTCIIFLSFISDPPNAPLFNSSGVSCDVSNGTYQAFFTFNNGETGGSEINYYNGTVTDPSGFSSEFNVTNTVVITGLQCSTSYTINVTAVNCAGVSTVNSTSFTTPQPSELSISLCLPLSYFTESFKSTHNRCTIHM